MRYVNFLVTCLFCLGALQADEPRWWIEGEYLYWWMKDSPSTVPLVVTGPTTDNFAPVLNEPGYSIVLGDEKTHNGGRSGFRVGGGYRFGSSQFFGLEANYLFLSSRTNKKSVSSSGELGSAFLTIPFFDVTTGLESSAELAVPGEIAGEATLKVTNSMQDAELLGSFKVLQDSSSVDLQVLTGFLWWAFKENLSFDIVSPYLPSVQPNEIYDTTDQFKTLNNFYGGQIGLKTTFYWNALSLLMIGKVALGAMDGQLKINGNLVTNNFTDYGPTVTYPGGYFAQTTNIGTFSKTRFSVIPQVNAQLGYDVTKWLNLNVGYTFLYASGVMWATNQIDPNENPSQSVNLGATPGDTTLVGSPEPKPLFRTSSFWVQGINAGVSFQY